MDDDGANGANSANGAKPPRLGNVSNIGVTVARLSGDAFEIRSRGHRLVVDQPIGAGGDDLGPTPTELFVASLAACVGVYAGRYLRYHGQAADGLRVYCRAIMSSDRPPRVTAISLRLAGLPALLERQRAALLAVVRHCTVNNSIRQAPQIHIELGAASGAAGRRPAATASEPR